MAEAPTKSTIKQLGLLQSMRDELSDQKKILKDNEENEQRHLPEVEDKINSWFWAG